jgi:hypothetical protein
MADDRIGVARLDVPEQLPEVRPPDPRPDLALVRPGV